MTIMEMTSEIATDRIAGVYARYTGSCPSKDDDDVPVAVVAGAAVAGAALLVAALVARARCLASQQSGGYGAED